MEHTNSRYMLNVCGKHNDIKDVNVTKRTTRCARYTMSCFVFYWMYATQAVTDTSSNVKDMSMSECMRIINGNRYYRVVKVEQILHIIVMLYT